MINSLWYQQDLKLETTGNMTRYGGSFVKALAECIARADKENLGKLEAAFPEYIRKYHPNNWTRK